MGCWQCAGYKLVRLPPETELINVSPPLSVNIIIPRYTGVAILVCQYHHYTGVAILVCQYHHSSVQGFLFQSVNITFHHNNEVAILVFQ